MTPDEQAKLDRFCQLIKDNPDATVVVAADVWDAIRPIASKAITDGQLPAGVPVVVSSYMPDGTIAAMKRLRPFARNIEDLATGK